MRTKTVIIKRLNEIDLKKELTINFDKTQHYLKHKFIMSVTKQSQYGMHIYPNPSTFFTLQCNQIDSNKIQLCPVHSIMIC